MLGWLGGNSVVTGNAVSHFRSLDFIAEAHHSAKFRSQLAHVSLLRTQGVSTQPCDAVRKPMRFDPFRTSLLSCRQNAGTSIRHQRPEFGFGYNCSCPRYFAPATLQAGRANCGRFASGLKLLWATKNDSWGQSIATSGATKTSQTLSELQRPMIYKHC